MKITNKAGFTLIELLVVILIIAILATIGLVLYGNVQKNSKDAKRRADIDQIANTYELGYSNGTYQSLAATQFTAGVIPTPPEGGNYVCNTGPSGGAISCTNASSTSFNIC